MLRSSLTKARPAFLAVALFSAASNVLMFIGPVFMLQVYERVIPSRSLETLLVLLVVVVLLFSLMGTLEHYRARILARIGARFENDLNEPVFRLVMRHPSGTATREGATWALRDLSDIRDALSAPATGSLFDMPYTPVFIGALFLFHPWLGWFTVASAVVLTGLSAMNKSLTKDYIEDASRQSGLADMQGQMIRKSAETVRGLGMMRTMLSRWADVRRDAISSKLVASDLGGGLSAITKTLRQILQSAILGLGALLVIRGELSAGTMIVASVLLGRALAPVEQVIAYWPQFERAMAAWKRLSDLTAKDAAAPPRLPLPRPKASLELKTLVVVVPNETQPVLNGLTMAAEGGDVIAVIGSSGAGKSTLARSLVGLIPAARGEIRLGGAELGQYDPDLLGGYIGYLPQDVVLFPGTVAQNISRFVPDADPDRIIAAATTAGAHDLILRLPDGYDTLVSDVATLSGGQRQRIGLARAFFGDPCLLVLDEPNSSLDDSGLLALNRAVSAARLAGRIVVVMSHRPSVLAECNKVLLLSDGKMVGYGDRDDMINRFLKPATGVAKLAARAQA